MSGCVWRVGERGQVRAVYILGSGFGWRASETAVSTARITNKQQTKNILGNAVALWKFIRYIYSK